jgi:tetratricopeptide (TPR) repeat protein
MLQQSIAAHYRAIELDPAIATSVAHTFFLTGDYASAIQSYGGRAAYYLDVAAWAALGEFRRAIELIRDRLETMSLSKLMTALMTSLLAVLEDRPDEAAVLMQDADTTREPEIILYFARHYARIGHADAAIHTLKRATEVGFLCAPETLMSDAWLSPLHRHPEFVSLLRNAEAQVEEARRSFAAYSGSRSL